MKATKNTQLSFGTVPMRAFHMTWMAIFSPTNAAVPAAGRLVLFGLFVHIVAGATYSVVPVIQPNRVGAVAGIGGNVGAVLAGLVVRGNAQSPQTGLLWLGGAVLLSAALSALVRFGRHESTFELQPVLATEAAAAE